jgi:hypothetical protein
MGKYRETYIKNTKEAITYHINKGAEFARPVKAIEQKSLVRRILFLFLDDTNWKERLV